ncbi:MAG TPA: protein kinase [Pyrinomonadaceae bacterium]
MSIEAGTHIGRYEIKSLLGVGGMGEVYRALDTELHRPVAMKFLRAEVAADEKRMQRFIQEARAASALNHPNILTVYEIGQADGARYFATEFVDGVTLRERMRSQEMRLREALDVAIQVASALVAAHEVGIVHRDIKPENIMIRRDGYVKVLDFGLAKLVEPQAASSVDTQALTKALVNTEPGVVMGTVSYMSPEQARGLPVDARTDIWSLGVVLYEMVAGRVPFFGETTSDIIAALLKTDAAPLKQVSPDVPDELQRIVGKALRHDRDERYQTTKDLLLDLRQLQRQSESEAEIKRSAALARHPSNPEAASAAATPSAAQSAAHSFLARLKSHPRVMVIALAAVLAVLAAGFVYLFRQPGAQPGTQPERPPSQRILSRLTFDPGLQSEPTWSPDGRFIAYSSDRSGNFDIWVQPVGEGNPVQVTKSEGHDWQPDWSADGKRIVFRSERDGGGLFVASAPTGGNERKISSFGYRPHWSPDGSQVLFYSTNLQNTPSPPKLYLVGLDGAPPREVLSEVLNGMTGRLRAAWHPDGQRISLWAEKRGTGGLSFVTVPLAGGPPVQSEMNPEVEGEIKAAGVALFDFRWSPSGRALYFEGISRGVRNLWKVGVDAQSLRWTAGPERLTTGAGLDGDIALSPDGGRLAFTTRTEQVRLWSLPFNAATGQVKSAGQPITPAGMNSYIFDVSRDGKRLAFITERADERQLWEKSFADGSAKLLVTVEGLSLTAPRWSQDGLRLAYVRSRPVNQGSTEYVHTFEHAIVLLDVGNGNEQVLTSPHQLQGWSWDWTADQQFILGSSARQSPDQWGLYLYPIAAAPNAETQMQLVSSQPGYNAFNARYSPDEKWICFIGIRTDNAGDGVIYVVSAAGGQWIRITEGSDFNDKPRWSPDGRTIYFISNRLGFFNVWGRRFDPSSGQPTGDMFRVTNFESPGRMIPPKIVPIALALTADRLVVPIMEVSGSIWILENVNR